MARVVYSLSKRQTEGQAEVLVRFFGGRGIDYRAKTQIYVPVARWDNFRQEIACNARFVTNDIVALSEKNKRLEGLRTAILSSFLSDPAAAVSADWLKGIIERYNHPETSKGDRMLLSDAVAAYSKAGEFADGTRKHYKVIQGMLDRFAEACHPIYTDSFTVDDIDLFTEFIRSEERETKSGTIVVDRGRNTIASKLKKLRAVCKWAVKRGLMTENPFDKYQIMSEAYGSPIILTIAERDRIATCTDLSPALSIQRDIFIFQCHVGCRVSDLLSFTHANVCEGVLVYVPIKTRNARPITIRVPLDETAAAIVAKYADSDPIRLLPFISSDKYNDAIKRAIRAAGVDRRVLVLNSRTGEYESKPICEVAASHLARRTFAGNLFKETRSERIVSSMTGHAEGSRAFARYTEVDDEMKIRAIQETDSKQKNADQMPT